MSSALIQVIKSEIADLERSLENDIRTIRVRELRKVLELYGDKIESHPRVSQGVSIFNVAEGPALPGMGTSRPATGGRRPSPEREQAISAARQFLSGRKAPAPTREILAYVENEGVSVPGEVPLNNLSAMLSNSDDFVSHGRTGWTLAETELRKVASEIHEGLTDHQVVEVIRSWESSHTIPQEIDSLILVQARAALNRMLSDAEKTEIRKDVIESLRQIPLAQAEDHSDESGDEPPKPPEFPDARIRRRI